MCQKLTIGPQKIEMMWRVWVRVYNLPVVVYIFVCLPVFLPLWMSVCHSTSLLVCLSVFLLVWKWTLSFYFLGCLSVCLPACLTVCFSFYFLVSLSLSVYLSAWMSVRQSTFLLVCLSGYLFVHVAFFLFVFHSSLKLTSSDRQSWQRCVTDPLSSISPVPLNICLFFYVAKGTPIILSFAFHTIAVPLWNCCDSYLYDSCSLYKDISIISIHILSFLLLFI